MTTKADNFDVIVDINSLEDLKKATGIQVSEKIEFEKPFQASKNELKKFKEEMDLLPETQKIERMKAFIREKSAVLFGRENKTDQLKIETKNALKKAAEKAKTGTEGAKEAVKDLSEKAKNLTSEEGIQKIKDAGADSIVSGIKDMFRKIFEFLASIPFIGGIFKAIGEILGIGKKLEEKSEELKEKSKKEAKKLKEISDSNISEINKKQIENVIYDKFSDILKKQYNVNLDDKLDDGKTTKGEKVKEILKDRLKGNYEKFIDPNKKEITFKVSDLYNFMGNGGGILFDLVKSGVIGISNLSFDLVSTANGTVKYIVKSVSGKDIGDLGLTGEIALDKIGDKNMSEQEKMFILAMFYRKGGFITEMLGHAAWIMTSGVSALGQLGLEKAGAKTDIVGTATAMIPGVDKKIQKMEEILSKFEKIAPANSKEAELMKSMIESSKNTIKALNIVKDFHEGKIKDLNTAKNMIGAIKKSESIHWAKKIAMEGTGFDTWNKQYLKEIYIEKNQKFIELLEKSFDKGNLRSLAKLQSYFKFLEIPSSANKSVMYFENESALNKFAQVLSQTPEMAKRFFTHMPIFIVGGVIINESYKPNRDTMKYLSYLIPIYGPLRLVGDSGITIDKQNWTIKIDNGADFVVSSLLLSIDGYFLTKAVLSSVAKRSIVPIGEFVVKLPVDIWKAGRAAVRFSGGTARLVTQTAIKIAESMEKVPNGRIKLAGRTVLAGIAVLIGVGILKGDEKPEDIKNKLLKEGIIDEKGNPIISKIKENFYKLQEDKKKSILDIIFASNISGYYKNEDSMDFSTKYNGSIYIVEVKNKKEKEILEKIILESNLYNDFEEINNIKIEVKA